MVNFRWYFQDAKVLHIQNLTFLHLSMFFTYIFRQQLYAQKGEQGRGSSTSTQAFDLGAKDERCALVLPG
jgi:hypothetical protein